ncbi:sigma-70 family RNA polymerase sigma factor [Cryobacterium sinapicolor]|uniref:Sigma-70 family RNA polymerase sigma factor n=2 Tax=Microbacteriaceae TaxID=85023 RepID=A0ABY2JDI8_9MICO|nr:sigma-70 family RNA polymerase sigma factor [Cryobacterium sp. TMT3-29-2]TFD03056.1 sigma-70 family RNA polymerase sigma factor [Cryobacterium sinapicolor]
MLVPMSAEFDIDRESTVPASQEELLGRVAQGNEGAFGELYDRMAPRVLGLVRRLLVDPSQSEEVTQEIFLEIWQTATRYEAQRGGAATWILTMAHRRAVDRIRSSQASRDRDIKIGIRDLAVAYDEVSETVGVRIEHERVERAMARLTELQRQAISLAYYGGLSQSEVAERLQIPLGTVKTRLRDGMIRLRDELGVAS